MKCQQCNKSLPTSEFAPTSSPFFPQSHINLCFGCVEQLVDGENLNQVDRFLQHCNIAFYPNEWRKLHKREGSGAFRKYTNMYYDMKYGKYDWGAQNEKLKEIARKGTADNEIEELQPQFLQQLKLSWGELPELDLVRLERFYNSSLTDYNVSTEAQRDMLRKICRLSVIIDDNLTKGTIDKDAIAQYDKLMNSALKTLETSQQEGITSVSELVSFIEQNGFQPKFYTGVAKDDIDMMMDNAQEYMRDLILGEVNLTDLYEGRKRVYDEIGENEEEGEE